MPHFLIRFRVLLLLAVVVLIPVLALFPAARTKPIVALARRKAVAAELNVASLEPQVALVGPRVVSEEPHISKPPLVPVTDLRPVTDLKMVGFHPEPGESDPVESDPVESDPVESDPALHALQQRLCALGVNYMRLGLTADSPGGPVYHFHCRLPVPDNPSYSRSFKACASEPLAAMRLALGALEAWHGDQDRVASR